MGSPRKSQILGGRKNRQGRNAAVLQGREKAEMLWQPQTLQGSGKSNICEVLVHDFTRHPGCPGALSGVLWLLSTSCSAGWWLTPVTAVPGTKICIEGREINSVKCAEQECNNRKRQQASRIYKQFHGAGFFLFHHHQSGLFLYDVQKTICRFEHTNII